jgi:uncharacterized protein (TIGR04551 family)
MLPGPRGDGERLRQLGDQRPEAATPSRNSQSGVFAEDWWSHARPAFEIHGYFRTRAELFHNFSLGRLDSPNRALWARPSDDHYTTANNDEFGPVLCTEDERGSGDDDNPTTALLSCDKKSQAGANLRFRLNPELHVSDNLRVMTQIDLLDNLVLGTTPDGYRYASGSNGYEVVQRSGYNQVGYYDGTQVPPSSGSNSLTDSIVVKRAWAEYTSPIGEVRFGRMPNHWGLGMVANAGDGYDDDYQSTVDRIMVATGIKPLDLTVAATWDFPNEGATGSNGMPGAQPYDLAQLDDVDQWSLMLMRKKSPQLEKLALSQGDLLVNGGIYLTYRTQLLANDINGTTTPGANTPDANLDDLSRSFSRRGAYTWVPDLWVQFLYKKFRFEAELAAVWGAIESLSTVPDNRSDFATGNQSKQYLEQYGLATELEQKLIEDRLRLRFNFGWASGDQDAYDPSRAGDLVPGPNEQQIADDTISTFRFHPAYRIDLILHRYILGRVQGTYYFKPGVEYDFIRDPGGQRIGGGAQVIWSRASEFVQAPGHATDLGLELNGSLYYQSRDGALNDSTGEMGGFYTMLQYGVLFPLAGLGYQSQERFELGNKDTSAAQILRWYLGVLF